MKAVLLAAGTGNRLGGLTSHIPKSMIPLKGKLLIDYVLDTLLSLPLQELIIVGGFEFEKLKKYLQGRDSRIQILENKKYQLGSIVTLKTALPHLNDEFFLFNADHIYPKKIISKLLEKTEGIFAACDFDRPLTEDDMKIKKSPEGYLTDISKKLTSHDGGYIGITYCAENTLALYKKIVDDVMEKTESRGVVEEVLATLIKNGNPPKICDASGIQWLEIDTPEDLAYAEKQIHNVTSTIY